MTKHKTGTRNEWLAAWLELLEAEKKLTGSASLADLFRGRSQLLVYHFMFGPDYTAGCPACSSIADGFDGFVIHLANHDVMLWAVSRAPLPKLQAHKRRMGWSFPWASSFGSDFNYDFNTSVTEEQQRSGLVEYNFRTNDVRRSLEAGKEGPLAGWTGSGACTSGSTGRPEGVTRRESGFAATTSTTSAEPSLTTCGVRASFPASVSRRRSAALRRQRGGDDRPVRVHVGDGRDADARRQ